MKKETGRAPKEYILEMAIYLNTIFESIKTAHELGEEVKVCQKTLYNIVVSHYEDLERLKVYHGITYPNNCKKAAYIIKWIAKLRPAYLYLGDKQPTEAQLFINEMFAGKAGLAMLDLEIDNIDRSIWTKFLYTLRYRTYDDGMLLLWVKTLMWAVSL